MNRKAFFSLWIAVGLAGMILLGGCSRGGGRQAVPTAPSGASQAQPTQAADTAAPAISPSLAPTDVPQPTQAVIVPATIPTVQATKPSAPAVDTGQNQDLDQLDQELSTLDNSLKSTDTINDFK
jgi:hypothetical protein